MTRHFKAIALAVSFAVALPASLAHAQSFEGLNVGKKKKKGNNNKRGSEKKEKDEEKKEDTEAPLPEGGLDLSKPAEEAKKPDDKPKKAAPTMSFDAVDVSGKSGDRQR